VNGDGSDSRMRIGFEWMQGEGWTGGLTYLVNLLSALRDFEPESATTLVLRPASLPEPAWEQFRGLSGGARIAAPPRRWSPVWALEHLRRLGRVPDRMWPGPIERVCLDLNLDVFFSRFVDTPTRVPRIGWIPDFQHVHLPAFFSDQDRAFRDRWFQNTARNARIVLLSSEDALRDFRAFDPQLAAKARVLRFVAHVPDEAMKNDPSPVCRQYHLPERFLYLPNQFWVHKNHRAVFEALKRLHQRRIRPFVVCTGLLNDYRAPMHFADLIQLVSRLGVRDQVAFLGLVPHHHVYLLMRQSVAVLNPSRFEGWNTAIEECKSLGKRAVLSDLAVHREQNPPGAVYFDPNDSECLADCLARVWETWQAGPDEALETAAREALPGRRRGFAKAFLNAAREAVGRSQQ